MLATSTERRLLWMPGCLWLLLGTATLTHKQTRKRAVQPTPSESSRFMNRLPCWRNNTHLIALMVTSRSKNKFETKTDSNSFIRESSKVRIRYYFRRRVKTQLSDLKYIAQFFDTLTFLHIWVVCLFNYGFFRKDHWVCSKMGTKNKFTFDVVVPDQNG